MFHVEMRSGIQLVREFNLSEQRLWLEFLAPLMADREFVVAGHEFTPRKTRMKVYEGPELRSDQLGLGRAWQNVERTSQDVTERVLQRAREHTRRALEGAPDTRAASVDLLRERLAGRLSAGPIEATELLTTAAELMPDATDGERRDAVLQAAWALLERGRAQLSPVSDR